MSEIKIVDDEMDHLPFKVGQPGIDPRDRPINHGSMDLLRELGMWPKAEQNEEEGG